MRILKTLVAAGAIAAATTALAVAPASAEPINPVTGKVVTPAAYDIVGVGSQSITYVVDQLTYNYDKTIGKAHSPARPYVYSWDAVPPSNLNNTTQMIVVKQGCKKNLRPNGSSAGVSALVGGYGTTSYVYKHHKHVVPCIDFARSSRPRKPADPPAGPGGVAFVALARDAVTYASTAKTNVPNNLTTAQLTEIFGCTVPAAHGFGANTWGALLGSGAKGASQAIDPILPQAGSGTLSFWATTALGLTSTSEPSCGTAATLTTPQQPEENEGTSVQFRIGAKASGAPNPNVIYPYSIGAYLSQLQNSSKCGARPSRTQNKFGCNQTGLLHLDGIRANGANIAPAVGKKGHMVTNPAWKKTVFERTLYDVVRWTASVTTRHIPAYLVKYLGSTGYFCKQPRVLVAYGFEPTVACGATN